MSKANQSSNFLFVNWMEILKIEEEKSKHVGGAVYYCKLYMARLYSYIATKKRVGQWTCHGQRFVATFESVIKRRQRRGGSGGKEGRH